MRDETDPPVQVRLYVETPDGEAVDDLLQVDRDEWDAMTPRERHYYLAEAADDHQNNICPSGFEVLGEKDAAAADLRG